VADMEKADDEQVTAGRASRSESSDDYGDDYRYRDKKSGKQRKCEKMKHKKRGKSSRKKRREKGDVSSDSSAEDDRTRRNEKVERHERKRSREEHRDPADEAAKLFKDVDRGLFLKVEKRLGKRPWLVSVGSAGSGGRRALHLAAAQGHFQLALLLIRLPLHPAARRTASQSQTVRRAEQLYPFDKKCATGTVGADEVRTLMQWTRWATRHSTQLVGHSSGR